MGQGLMYSVCLQEAYKPLSGRQNTNLPEERPPSPLFCLQTGRNQILQKLLSDCRNHRLSMNFFSSLEASQVKSCVNINCPPNYNSHMAKKGQPGQGSFSKSGNTYIWRRKVGNRSFVVKRSDYTSFRNEVDRRQKEIAALGTSSPPRDQRLDQFLPPWMEAFLAPPNSSRATHEGYEYAWQRIKPRLGKVKVSKITEIQCVEWMNKLRSEGVGDSSLSTALSLLKKALAYAVKHGYAPSNAAADLKQPKSSRAVIRVFSPHEQAAILKAAYGARKELKHRAERCPTRYRHLFRFLFSTGLRIGEALGLLRTKVDLSRGVCHVHAQLVMQHEGEWDLLKPKGKKYRTIVLEPDAIKAIRQHLAMVRRERPPIEDYEDNGLIFASLRGTPGYRGNVQRQLDVLLEELELDHASLHDLRRTCLTNLANRGMAMHQLQAYAGHSLITTTAKYYLQVSLEAQRAELEGLKPLSATIAKDTTQDTKTLRLPKPNRK